MMFNWLLALGMVLGIIFTFLYFYRKIKMRRKIFNELRPKIHPYLNERREAIKLIRKLQHFPYFQVEKEVEEFLRPLNKEDENIIL